MRLDILVLPLLASVSVARPLLSLGALTEWAFNSAQSLSSDVDDRSELTIWEQLQADEHYTRLVKLLKFEGSILKDLDKTQDNDLYEITFFAPTNEALHPPHHGGRHREADEHTLATLSEVLETSEPWLLDDKGDDDDEKKRRREIFKKIVHAVLEYHILPFSFSGGELVHNKTYETALKIHSAIDGLPQRLRVEGTLLPPGILINWYARIVASSEAKNGHLHGINHPLLPPASIFDEVFFTTRWASTTASAVQRVHGNRFIDYSWHHSNESGKSGFHGAPIATFYTPSNEAWERLPRDLHFFLFTRFGYRALKKVLAYHYVPHTLVLSELVHHKDHDKKKELVEDHLDALADDEFHHEFEVHSGLGPKAPLSVVVDKKKIHPIPDGYHTSMTVNGVSVKGLDINARNGAWHIIDRVLCPPHHHGDGGDKLMDSEDPWADWPEEHSWLPAWADEELDYQF